MTLNPLRGWIHRTDSSRSPRGRARRPALEPLEGRSLLSSNGPLSASPAAADVKISGGGTADFDAGSGGTTFSVQARIAEDGSVRGHFVCVIPGVVTIVGGDLTSATVNADGSVTLVGFGHGRDDFGVFTEMPFEVRLWAGGPGVGRFIYDDPFVGSTGVDTDIEGDHETVATGHIKIKAG